MVDATWHANYYLSNRHKMCRQNRRAHLKRNYGISLEDFDKLLEEQKGYCAICERGDRNLCVDHDHNTSKVRGLICRQCNSGIGQFNDNVDTVQRAVDYLRKY